MTTLTTYGSIFKSTHAGAARLERTVAYIGGLLAKWKAERAAARADEEMWAFAHSDPRLMAEIHAALSNRK